MKLDFDALLVLASNFRNRTVRLSDESLALFISLTSYSDQRWQWENAGEPLNAAQWDVAEQIVARAALEIMTPLVGMIMPVALAVLPDGWLPCDGATYQAVDYPELFAVMDSAYKLASTFTVPDLRERVPVGEGVSYPLNSQGGQAEQTLTVDQIPSHSHTDLGHTHGYSGVVVSVEVIGADIVPIPSVAGAPLITSVGNANIQPTGGGLPHNNIQPYTSVRWAIIAR